MKAGRHICTVCNTIYEEPHEDYDPSKPEFDSLPENWKCECGASKDKFQPCSCVSVTDAKIHTHENDCSRDAG